MRPLVIAAVVREAGGGEALPARSALSVEDIEVLYRHFSFAIVSRCRDILRQEEAAWDAMHQTFIKALAYRKTFDGRAEPLTWLYSIALRVCFDAQKRLRKSAEREVFDLSERATSDGGSGEQRVLERCTVSKLLARIEPELQEVAVLRYFDELELEEIASATGLSTRTVSRRLVRFHERAREIIEAET